MSDYGFWGPLRGAVKRDRILAPLGSIAPNPMLSGFSFSRVLTDCFCLRVLILPGREIYSVLVFTELALICLRKYISWVVPRGAMLGHYTVNC